MLPCSNSLSPTLLQTLTHRAVSLRNEVTTAKRTCHITGGHVRYAGEHVHVAVSLEYTLLYIMTHVAKCITAETKRPLARTARQASRGDVGVARATVKLSGHVTWRVHVGASRGVARHVQPAHSRAVADRGLFQHLCVRVVEHMICVRACTCVHSCSVVCISFLCVTPRYTTLDALFLSLHLSLTQFNFIRATLHRAHCSLFSTLAFRQLPHAEPSS